MRDQGPIVVPLDGSELAEGALAYAVALARPLGAGIVLVTAWRSTESDLGVEFPAMAAAIETKAREHYGSYLDAVKSKIGDDVKVEPQIRAGDATEQILRAVDESDARLLVIATHGRSGLSRWMRGSTAAHLVHESPVPAVSVGPRALQKPAAAVSIDHLMVPLDGSPSSEQAIPLAVSLAKALGARLSFVRAVRWAAQQYPYAVPDSYIPQVDEELEAGAKIYLKRQEDAVKDMRIEAFVVRGAIADGLLDFVQQRAVDLVVMTTHARTGLARAALGSVADRMVHGHAPVLTVRPSDR